MWDDHIVDFPEPLCPAMMTANGFREAFCARRTAWIATRNVVI
jgi:hypothetical protein